MHPKRLLFRSIVALALAALSVGALANCPSDLNGSDSDGKIVNLDDWRTNIRISSRRVRFDQMHFQAAPDPAIPALFILHYEEPLIWPVAFDFDHRVSVSKNGRWVALSLGFPGDEENLQPRVNIYSRDRRGALAESLLLPEAPTFVTFVPNLDAVVVGLRAAGRLRVYSIATGRGILEISAPSVENDERVYPLSLDFSPDGERIFMGWSAIGKKYYSTTEGSFLIKSILNSLSNARAGMTRIRLRQEPEKVRWSFRDDLVIAPLDDGRRMVSQSTFSLNQTLRIFSGDTADMEFEIRPDAFLPRARAVAVKNIEIRSASASPIYVVGKPSSYWVMLSLSVANGDGTRLNFRALYLLENNQFSLRRVWRLFWGQSIPALAR